MRTALVICTIFISSLASAQTGDEWFHQKKTKLKYIEQQIAAFEVYAGFLKKGYDVVDEGWHIVDNIKHGDFDLHNNYFTSLKQVNRAVGDYDKVEGIQNLQLQILEINEAIKKFIQTNKNLQAEEKDYINQVMSNLLNKCADNLDELKMLITSDSLSMKDDERLKRINGLYDDMQDKYDFAKYFQNSVQTLALSREKVSNDVTTSKLLYGIK